MFGKNQLAPLVRDLAQTDDRYWVQEVFATIQGEGPFAGMPAIFVRMAGCNLKCHFCFGWRKGNGPYLSMAKGPQKQLGKASIGDWILTLDENGQIVETEIINIEREEVDQWVEVIIKGTKYCVTPEHPFFTTRGLISAASILAGDEIIHVNSRDIISWKKLGEKNPMKDPAVAFKSASSTDYKQMGLTLAATIKRKKKDGTYTSSWAKMNSTARAARQKKISEGKLGEKNPRYKANLANRNWCKLKAKVATGGIKCNRCRGAARDVHHRDHDHSNDNPKNLEPLCHPCHSKEHNTGLNFWASPRKDGKVLAARNGLLVSSVKHCSGQPLPITRISCHPYKTYLVDNFLNHNCDTDFESSEWHPPVEELHQAVLSKAESAPGSCLIVFTGGEPLRQPLGPIIDLLLDDHFQIQIETAGSIWDPSLTRADELDWVCSPKTGSVNTKIEEFCFDFKYIVRAGDSSSADGLPICSTQSLGVAQKLYRPRAMGTTVWVQPCEEYRDGKVDRPRTAENVAHAVTLCQKYGYRLSYQVHKAIGMP